MASNPMVFIDFYSDVVPKVVASYRGLVEVASM